LPASRAVANDVSLGGDTRVLVVSGSNMSGKSTLLRTVGVNVVLALAGAPVRAARMHLSPLSVGATLRIQDSLQAGRSRFFAEISRLKQIVDLSGGQLPVLFLLDELLSGTNSHDRRQGAAGVVQGLVDRGAIGLVTTHDLALAEVVSDLGVHARNVHFSDTFDDGQLRFDYVMRDGVVRTSNALELMRSIGLSVEPGRTAQPTAGGPKA
jgi:DNA mismatch repair ATPase MutS